MLTIYTRFYTKISLYYISLPTDRYCYTSVYIIVKPAYIIEALVNWDIRLSEANLNVRKPIIEA